MIDIAQKYVDSGLSIVGCRNKRPVDSWNNFQKEQPTPDQVEKMFTLRNADQIAIICGVVSGNLEVIDVDVKGDDTIREKIMADFTDYFDGEPNHYLVCASTQSGGLHFYYKCATIEGNQKLAKKENKEVILETRGEGGYVIAPPSPGYALLFGSLDNIKIITEDQRDDLLSICRSYNEYTFNIQKTDDKPKNIPSLEYSVTPWDQYNDDENNPWIEVLTSQGWEEIPELETSERLFFKRPGTEAKQSANWHKEKRLFYVWSSSTEFEPEKAYTPAAIYAVMECGGDFNKAAIRFKEKGYGKPFNEFEGIIISKAAEKIKDGLTPELVKDLLQYNFDQYNIKDPKDKKKLLDLAEYKVKCEKGLFWDLGKRGRIDLNVIRFAKYLSDNGFKRLYGGDKEINCEIIHFEESTRIAYHTNSALIKDELDIILERYNWADFNITLMQARLLVATIGSETWKLIFDKMEKVISSDVIFIRDTQDESYFPFENKIVRITKSEIEFKEYSDLPEKSWLWNKQVIKRKVELKDITHETQKCDSDFYRFIKRLCGVRKVKESEVNPKILEIIKDGYQEYGKQIGIENYYNTIDKEDFYMNLEFILLEHIDKILYNRIISVFTTLGYLLTNYKDPSNAYCITIGEDTEDDGLGGGTGKSLIMEALGKLRNIEKEDGKTWKIDGSFAFQKIRHGLDIFYIEDAKKNFKFETIYNLITNDTVIERKNQTAFSMPFKETPKIAISTNYDVTTPGDHGDRRSKMILVSRYFNKNYQPLEEFGKRFFDEWDDTDWNDFYNSMFCFVQFYHMYGVQNFEETQKMKIKSVKIKYDESFYEYMIYFFQDYDGKEMVIREMYDDYVEEYDNKKYWSLKRFGKAIQFMCDKFDVKCTSTRKRQSAQYGDKKERFYKFENFSILQNIANQK